jgi:DNA-directed RNA polymerase subunit L
LNLKINSVGDGALQVVIEKEDYSIADIVHKELMNVKHVKFAGVPPPHPLIKTLTIEVSTDSSNPTKALQEALDLSQRRVSELLKLAKEIFPIPPPGSVPPEEMHEVSVQSTADQSSEQDAIGTDNA